MKPSIHRVAGTLWVILVIMGAHFLSTQHSVRANKQPNLGDDRKSLPSSGGVLIDLAISYDEKTYAVLAASWGKSWVAVGKVDSPGRALEEFDGSVGADSVAFSPDGRQIAFGRHSGIAIHSLETRKKNAVINERSQYILSTIAFSPDGKRIAGARRRLDVQSREPQAIRTWDAETGKLLQTFIGHQDSVRSVTFNRTGDRLASASNDGTVRIWDSANGKQMMVLPASPDANNQIAFSSDGKRLAAACGAVIGNESRTGEIVVWDVASGKETLRIAKQPEAMGAVAFSPDGKFIVSGNRVGQVTIWDAVSGAKITDFRKDSELSFDDFRAIRRLVYSADSRRLFIADKSGEILIWTRKF